MIVEKKATFDPVTITLTTQDELDYLTELFYHSGGALAIEVFGDTSVPYLALVRAGGRVERADWRVTGNIILSNTPAKE